MVINDLDNGGTLYGLGLGVRLEALFIAQDPVARALCGGSSSARDFSSTVHTRVSAKPSLYACCLVLQSLAIRCWSCSRCPRLGVLVSQKC
jgi:hypothetical protein